MTNIRYPLELGMAGFCLLLAIVFIYECAAPLPALNPPALTLTPRIVRTETTFYSPPSEASFSVIDERPIFSPTRKPIEAAEAPGSAGAGPASIPPPPNVTLVGVITDGQNQLALVKTQGAFFASSVAVGATLDGWQVTQITADRVILRAGAAEMTLFIGGAQGSQSTAPRLQITPGTVGRIPNIPGSDANPPGPPVRQ